MTTAFAPINGASLYYEIQGEGFPVIFLHAGIADHRQWNTQMAAFAQHYKTIRFDLRGYGKSEPVAGEFSYTADLIALMNYLDIPAAHLIGCSMGGIIALEVARIAPERVATVVMVGSLPNGFSADVPEHPLQAEAEVAYEAQDWHRLNEIEVQMWFDGKGRAPADMDADTRALVLDMNHTALVNASKGEAVEAEDLQPATAEILDQLELPVLLVYGDLDMDEIIAANEYMAENLPDVTEFIMENTAHLPNMERPNDFNKIVLEFLVDVDRDEDEDDEE